MTPASTLDEEFAAAVSRHDTRIAALGLTIWVGSEPTFTDRCAQSPEWLSKPLGGDKEQRAEALLRELCWSFPGGLLLRSVGRQYPGEQRPRWNLGLYQRRNGDPIWYGPPDPMLAPAASASSLGAAKAGRRLQSTGPGDMGQRPGRWPGGALLAGHSGSGRGAAGTASADPS